MHHILIIEIITKIYTLQEQNYMEPCDWEDNVD